MPSVSLKISDEFKAKIDKLPWVNWSEAGREQFIEEFEKDDKLQRVLEIVSKSKFTQKDADELSKKIKQSMHDRLKREGLI